MSTTVGGVGPGGVVLNYQFQVGFRHSSVGAVVISESFTHRGIRWQLDVTQATKVPFGKSEFRCQLELADDGGNQKPKMVRICVHPYVHSPVAIFHRNGDKMSLTVAARYTQSRLNVEVLKELDAADFSTIPMENGTNGLKWIKEKEIGEVTIVASDGQKFRCHREVLVRQGEVFLSMFIAGMKEDRENLINIEDFDGEVVAQLLQFFYTGGCEEIKSTADRLYAAAHKYQLDRLKQLCAYEMVENLSADSIMKTLRVAHVYDVKDLLSTCHGFLGRHKDVLPITDILNEAMGIE